jgi:hypothetical protein
MLARGGNWMSLHAYAAGGDSVRCGYMARDLKQGAVRSRSRGRFGSNQVG